MKKKNNGGHKHRSGFKNEGAPQADTRRIEEVEGIKASIVAELRDRRNTYGPKAG